MAGRKKTRLPLDVFLNGRLVGRLRREASGAVDFQYAPSWLGWENTFPVSLSLPLREDRYIGAPVVAVFDNLLPDNDRIRQRLAARTQAEGTDAFSLLSAVGRDCPGALQFLPEGEAPSTPGAIEGRPLSDADIAAILADLANTPLGVTAGHEFRISLAGAQEKTALLLWKDRWHIPHGSTPTTHIFKPPIGRLDRGIDLSDSIENEFFCLKLAREIGFPSADVAIAAFGDNRALIVERFDRRWTIDGRLLRLPQEDCCQALSVPPTRKYEADGGPGIARLLDLLKASDDPAADQRIFIRAQIFFWLLGATDGHAKNFSLQLLPGGRFRLAPLYDIMSTQPYVDTGQLRRNQFKLAMAAGKNRHYIVDEVLPRHFVQTAGSAGVGKAVVDDVLADIATAMPRALEAVTRTLPENFPARLIDQITSGIQRRLHTIEASAA
ncbi:MAG: type II toxin-antitoxin system HipA family toxin [Betaproteobacteria bacterium]|nr:type II toxin-antitoxin system HipA family toxin [Betaproteobacteria bacterium]